MVFICRPSRWRASPTSTRRRHLLLLIWREWTLSLVLTTVASSLPPTAITSKCRATWRRNWDSTSSCRRSRPMSLSGFWPPLFSPFPLLLSSCSFGHCLFPSRLYTTRGTGAPTADPPPPARSLEGPGKQTSRSRSKMWPVCGSSCCVYLHKAAISCFSTRWSRRHWSRGAAGCRDVELNQVHKCFFTSLSVASIFRNNYREGVGGNFWKLFEL